MLILLHESPTEPTSGKVYISQRVLGKREGGMERWVEEGQGTDQIAMFGRYGSIRGASEHPDKNNQLMQEVSSS
jgi:hypothetical protein